MSQKNLAYVLSTFLQKKGVRMKPALRQSPKERWFVFKIRAKICKNRDFLNSKSLGLDFPHPRDTIILIPFLFFILFSGKGRVRTLTFQYFCPLKKKKKILTYAQVELPYITHK